MRIALWIYILLFAAICVWSYVDPELRGTPGELALDVVLSTVALTGMVGYALRLDAPRLMAAWRFVAPALLAGLIVQSILEWPSLMAAEPQLDDAEQRVLAAITLVVSAIFLTPAVLVNFRFARGRHLNAGA